MEQSLRLGILGGTFDPIHLGHLRSAEEIGEKLDLTRVYLIPSASPPHKTGTPVSGFEHRLAMTRAAAGQSPLLEALDLEGKRPGLSYSIETLKEFRAVFGAEADLFFVVGTDAFVEIDTWKAYQDLFEYAHFVVIPRPGFQDQGLHPVFEDLGVKRAPNDAEDVYTAPSGKKIILMSTTLMDISSTGIRERVRANRSIRFLVPEAVRIRIQEKELYQDHGHVR
ncbi:MAG: nicotinate-nucleotide adenylyltransferase [Desulfatiglandaceae bacterium]